jgi:hypothetical protein
MSTGYPSPSRAVVVVDVESVRARTCMELPFPERPFPTVAGISRTLAAAGLEVVDVTFVVGETPLPGPHRREVAERGDRVAQQVLDEVIASSSVPARMLGGFLTAWRTTDGKTRFAEVGVDGLLVAAALQRADEIDRGLLDAHQVVVVSHDPDTWIAHRYPHVTPVVYAGAFDDGELQDIARHGSMALDLSGSVDGLLHRSGGPDPAPAAVPASTAPAVRHDPEVLQARSVERYAAMTASASVAVVDVYDMFSHALSALGSARMPSPTSVRAVSEQLHLPGPVAVYAAVPDIPDALLPTDRSARACGWRLRDEQFADTVERFSTDGDPSTQATVGELLVGEDRPTRLRRIVTTTVADAFWALASSEAEVAVFSDRWDIVALQWHLRDLGVERPERLVRVGSQPLAIEDGPDAHILLTDELLALLVDAPRAWGRRRHLELARVDRDGVPRRWVVADLEPESDCAVLVPLDSSEQLDAVHPGSDAPLGHQLVLDHVGLRLNDSTAVVPRLTSERTPWPATTLATVVDRFEPTAVLVDLTGDGLPDAEVSTGRDSWPLPRGTRLRLAHTSDGLTYLGPEPPAADIGTPPPPPEPVRIEETSPGRARGYPMHRPDEDVEVVPLPGVELAAGDRVLAAPSTGGVWRAFSTDLRYLDR